MADGELPRLYILPGVDLNGLQPAGCRILAIACYAPLHLGWDVYITSGKEGHQEGDPHTRGEGLDFRTKHLTVEQKLKQLVYFRQQLGPTFFTVLYEVPVLQRAALDPSLLPYVYLPSDPNAEHMHCQEKKGTDYAPSPGDH